MQRALEKETVLRDILEERLPKDTVNIIFSYKLGMPQRIRELEKVWRPQTVREFYSVHSPERFFHIEINTPYQNPSMVMIWKLLAPDEYSLSCCSTISIKWYEVHIKDDGSLSYRTHAP
jgi:hypothetical protein